MASSRQASFAQVEWEGRARRTRRAELPGQTGSVVPRAEAAGPGRAAGDGRGQARQAALARRGAARDAPRAVLAGPDGRRLRGRLPRLALGPRLRGVPVPRARRLRPPGTSATSRGRATSGGPCPASWSSASRPPAWPCAAARWPASRSWGRQARPRTRRARATPGRARPRGAAGGASARGATRGRTPAAAPATPTRAGAASPRGPRSRPTRASPGPAGASRWAPPGPGPRGGPGGTGAGRSGAEASVRARASAPARSPGAPSATRRSATAASRRTRARVSALLATGPSHTPLPVTAEELPVPPVSLRLAWPTPRGTEGDSPA